MKFLEKSVLRKTGLPPNISFSRVKAVLLTSDHCTSLGSELLLSLRLPQILFDQSRHLGQLLLDSQDIGGNALTALGARLPAHVHNVQGSSDCLTIQQLEWENLWILAEPPDMQRGDGKQLVPILSLFCCSLP